MRLQRQGMVQTEVTFQCFDIEGNFFKSFLKQQSCAHMNHDKIQNACIISDGGPKSTVLILNKNVFKSLFEDNEDSELVTLCSKS